MRIRQTMTYEIECKGCKSLLQLEFKELRFKGLMDQRIPCPACGRNILVVQGGMITDDVQPKVRDKAWRETREDRNDRLTEGQL